MPGPTSTRKTAAARDQQLPVVAVAAATALALVFFMISSVTGAAWTDTTENPGNSWATGAVVLTDDLAGVAMFDASNLLPGDVVTNSITVTNESSVDLDVRLFGADFAETNDLAAHLNLMIGTTDGGHDVYTGTAAGTLDGFRTAHTSFANGTPVISIAAAASQTYYFWVELDAAAPDSVQASSAQIDLVWEGQTQ